MILKFLSGEIESSLDFVDFDGLFCLLFDERLEKFSEEFSDLGLYLIPLKLFDCDFLTLSFLFAHFLLFFILSIIYIFI